MTDVNALVPRPAVMDFLRTRRSRPAKTLRAPAPGRDDIAPLLEAALRVPDHGKLEPWRLIVLDGAALTRLGALAAELGAEHGLDADKVTKARAMFETAPLMVAVVSAPVASPKIPEVEQTLSAGAVCLSLVNAAMAAGWGANWLSGWMAYDRDFLTRGLSLTPTEWVAGYIVLGTETTQPTDRPRPDVAAKTTWVAA